MASEPLLAASAPFSWHSLGHLTSDSAQDEEDLEEVINVEVGVSPALASLCVFWSVQHYSD